MSIRLKLIIMFLAIALIPLLLVSALTFNNYKYSLEENRLAQLRDLVSFKADKIETYFAGLRAETELLQNSYVIKQNLPVLIRLAASPAAPEFVSAKKTIDDLMRDAAMSFGIFDIMLLDAGGKVVYSLNPKHSTVEFSGPLPGPGQKAFEKGKGGFYFSDIYCSKLDDDKPLFLVTAPAWNVNNVAIGVIAMKMDMASVYKLIQEVTGLGKTGETLIGKKDGKQVVYLNPLRHDPEAALKRRVTIGGLIGSGIQKAVEGHNGAGLIVDYRGKEAVAAWRYIPSLDWGLVAKIDAQEAFSDVLNLRNLIFIILGIIVVLSAIMAVSIAQSVSGPIKIVAQGAEIIGSGNLDYKIATDSRDEIGQLARTFDKMAQDLKSLGLARDTERQRFYGVLETLPVYVVLLTEDYHVPFANKFFRERFGESRGKCCYEYLFNRAEPCENCETFKVLKTGQPHHWEWTGPDGRNYEVHDFPFRDTAGASMILEMGIDITEQKRAQESLRSASLYARNLIEVSLDPLVTISHDGKITDVNEATIKATGAQREQLIGADFSDYFTEPEKAREGYQQVFARGVVTDYPLTIRRKDGHLTDVLYNASVYKDTHGNVLGVFAAARDVTLLKQAEAELRRHRDNLEVLVKERTSELEMSNKELSRANENLEQFAYVASHDLQEPLRIMASYSQLLEKRYRKKLDKDADEFINFIVDVLGKVIASMSPAIEESGALITHDALPKLMANESSLIQLFMNMIGNALKFRGAAPPLIHIGAKRQKTEWLFSVRDNGIGLEDKYKDRIFLIFQRLHGRDKYPGTGIGLSICKKIVEMLGGRIWVESELGKGAVFYFTLPVVRKTTKTQETMTK